MLIVHYSRIIITHNNTSRAKIRTQREDEAEPQSLMRNISLVELCTLQYTQLCHYFCSCTNDARFVDTSRVAETTLYLPLPRARNVPRLLLLVLGQKSRNTKTAKREEAKENRLSRENEILCRWERQATQVHNFCC